MTSANGARNFTRAESAKVDAPRVAQPGGLACLTFREGLVGLLHDLFGPGHSRQPAYRCVDFPEEYRRGRLRFSYGKTNSPRQNLSVFASVDGLALLRI